MFFRNLTFFTFPEEVARTIAFLLEAPIEDGQTAFNGALAKCALKPVGPLEMASRGFVSPFGRGEAALSHVVGHAVWLTLGGEDKILPPAVIYEELGKKIAAIEEAEGRKLGGKARMRIKDDVVHELLPRAFTRPSRVNAYLDLKRGFIAVDTSSRKVAEGFVTELRHALGSFPVVPLNAEVSVRACMTSWLAGEPLPEGLSLGEDVDLKDTIDHGAVAKLSNQELLGDEVRKHLESGKQAVRLALLYDERVSFTIGEDLALRKVKFLDGAVESLEQSERDSLHAELYARFALMSAEVARLFTLLATSLKFSQGKELPASPPRPKPETVTVTITAGDRTVYDSGATDPIYQTAVEMVRRHQSASISGLQRRMGIGFNRAARLIEAMEAAGLVSTPHPNGDRDVLLKE